MIETPLIFISRESAILAHGISPTPIWRRKIFITLVLGLVTICLAVWWIGFERQMDIPEQAFFLGQTRPKTMRLFLPFEFQEQLPNVWQRTIASDSRWKVTFIAARMDDRWSFFVIKPRWLVEDGERVFLERGFLALVGDHDLSSTRPFRQSEAQTWRTTWFSSQIDFWIEPRLVLGLNRNSQALSPFTASLKNGRLSSSLRSSSGESTSSSLRKADLSLTFFGANRETAFLFESLMQELGLGDLIQDSKIIPSGIHVFLGENRVERALLEYPKDFDVYEARLLLARLGVYKNRSIELPDRTTIEEQRLLPSSTTQDLLGTYRSSRFGFVKLEKRALVFGDASSTQEFKWIEPCGKLTPYLRLSSVFWRSLLRDQGFDRTFFPSFQIGFDDHRRLVACAE